MREVYFEDLEEAIATWGEVRGETCDWGRYREFQSRGLKWFLESSLQEAVTGKLGVAWHVRSKDLCGQRNGFYVWRLVTPCGSVDVMVPRLRDGSYEHGLWDSKGLLIQPARDLILETYLSGSSTRRVGEVL